MTCRRGRAPRGLWGPQMQTRGCCCCSRLQCEAAGSGQRGPPHHETLVLRAYLGEERIIQLNTNTRPLGSECRISCQHKALDKILTDAYSQRTGLQFMKVHSKHG